MIVSAVRCLGTPSGQKFPLPTQAFASKLQIPVLPDINTGIWCFEMGLFNQLFAINIPGKFGWYQQFVGD